MKKKPIIYSDLSKKQLETLKELYIQKKVESMSHQELKKLGGVKPPKEFVFMDRAAVGLGSVFMHLKAEVNWYRIFHELIEDFNSKKLMENQQKALKIANLSI